MRRCGPPGHAALDDDKWTECIYDMFKIHRVPSTVPEFQAALELRVPAPSCQKQQVRRVVLRVPQGNTTFLHRPLIAEHESVWKVHCDRNLQMKAEFYKQVKINV